MQRLALLLLFIFTTAPAFAQRVSPENSHTRFLAIDRMITDAKGRKVPAHAQGMLGFAVAACNPTATLCIVEYVGRKDSDFNALRADRDPGVKAFDKGLTRKRQFLDAARAAGFTAVDLDKIFVRAQ